MIVNVPSTHSVVFKLSAVSTKCSRDGQGTAMNRLNKVYMIKRLENWLQFVNKNPPVI